jgi:putative tricarboxylic transport membrane protein
MSGASSNSASLEDAGSARPEGEPTDDYGYVDGRIDIAVCAAIFLLGLGLVVFSSDIRQGSIPDPIGPDGWPKLLGATLMLTMGANILRRLVSWRSAQHYMVPSDGGKDDVSGQPGTVIRPLAMLSTAAAWVLLVPWLGYIVATSGLLFAGLSLMKVRSPAKLLLVPFLISLSTWLLFGVLFGIRLHAGPIEHALIEILPRVR